MFEQAINDQILTWKWVVAVAASEAAVNEVFVLSEYSPLLILVYIHSASIL